MPRPLHIMKAHLTPDMMTWKDFSGAKDRNGKSNFTLRFSEEEGEHLDADTWHINWKEDDQGNRYATLRVNIDFHGDSRDPIVETATRSSKKKTRLYKEDLHLLDDGVMLEFAVDIRPWWNKDKGYYTAYLQRIFVLQEDDIFSREYPQFYEEDDGDFDEDEEMPFN